MRLIPQYALLLSTAAALGGGDAGAQTAPADAPRIEIVITDELILPQGEVRSVVRDSSGNLVTRPGDIIQYTLTATNTGRQAAHDVEIVDPIPAGTEYVLDSAAGEGMIVSYSIDGGKVYQPGPAVYDHRRPDGVTEERAAPASRYSHVKWLVSGPLTPGGQATALLRVRVVAASGTEEEE